MKRRCFVSLLGQSLSALWIQASQQIRPGWDIANLSTTPFTYPLKSEEPGVNALFYEGVPYRGKPTRVFAYYGFPRNSAGPFPGIVLVHGGDGTAFAEWVRLWTSRGYAAIAMDTTGSKPDVGRRDNPYLVPSTRHAYAGPPGWGGFNQIDDPPGDQWTYHAVAAVIRANSLLRSFKTVDPNRVGLTGISWGGFLGLIAASLDKRFSFAAPVYGCGFLTEDSMWLPDFRRMGPKRAGRWRQLWDPAGYIPEIRMPTLWVDGTNDLAFPLPSLRKSYGMIQARRTLSMRVRMPHDHPNGAKPAEILAFANGVLGLEEPLASVSSVEMTGGSSAKVEFRSSVPILKAELNFTTDTGAWKDRRWQTIAAKLGPSSVTAEVPPSTRAFFLNLIDRRGLMVSSEVEILG